MASVVGNGDPKAALMSSDKLYESIVLLQKKVGHPF
ncbi:hypothetical protein B0I63_001711 [Clostridium beijerinckii]|uniref:Uncharacterized protein n=1 Tax=Clostridium beijerinckii TaxID=1520 RepID=A0A9Q5CBR1_CLOBE|nr:hypothetical protein [Clostridium beijerinckii]MBA2899141.1 hypothetical protein [Clostridium beijerinckii]MBA2908543.1 hypothetical protein [Clostridium beijerinckii]MBA9016295.1 hypothetical protein [Clostridium beijerinckii]NRT01281.1 hypothetical protein [Clostridium beijerinckii]